MKEVFNLTYLGLFPLGKSSIGKGMGIKMENNIFSLIQEKKQRAELATIKACNEKTERFGLVLSEEEATELVCARDNTLRKYKRVEFGQGILDQIIFSFCDSQYITQDCYFETMKRIQDIFYEFKNESADKLQDEELLTFMREQFDNPCMGDLDYLEGTCLPRFVEAIRAGYRGYESSGGHGEYTQFDEETRWDEKLYQQALAELF